MRMRLLPTLLCGATFIAVSCGSPDEKQPQAARHEAKSEGEIELVGTVRKPKNAKMAHRLEIYPAGNLKVIEMLGDALKKVPANAAVRVRGVVKSQVVGPAKDDPDPYPIQWGVWLRVSQVEVFPSLEEAFREPRERHLRERDR